MVPREKGNKGPVVRAAVPAFSGAPKEIDSDIEQPVLGDQNLVNRVSQPVSNQTPHLEADEALELEQLNGLLQKGPSSNRNSSIINEERKAGVPKVSAEQFGKYGKKAAHRTSLLQLKEEIRRKANGTADSTTAVKDKRIKRNMYNSESQSAITPGSAAIVTASKKLQSKNQGHSPEKNLRFKAKPRGLRLD